jgi:hypothetical protein
MQSLLSLSSRPKRSGGTCGFIFGLLTPTYDEVIVWSMKQINLVLLFKLFTVLALAIVALLFGGDFRGGRPRTPMHPSPADDSALLWKRRSRKKNLQGIV